MILIYVTSAFSKDHAGGNKAGVVFDHPELTNMQKMQISKLLGYSETAFVTKSSCADYKLEYFTPTEEVPLCGHATIATFATLHLLGLLKKAEALIETRAGILQVHVGEDGLVMMQQNQPAYYEMIPKDEVLPSFGGKIAEECLAEVLQDPIQIISTGLKDIILPVASRKSLDGLCPDFPEMTEFSRKMKVVGFHAFSPNEEGEADAFCRNFAPLYGINEESATGTASCALAGYFYRYLKKKPFYVFEQGHAMGLPSRIVVKLEADKDQIQRIFVGGYGYLVDTREIMEEILTEETDHGRL